MKSIIRSVHLIQVLLITAFVSLVRASQGGEITNFFVKVDAVLFPAVRDSSVTWVDYNNDGRLDLLITGLNESNIRTTELWQNTGNEFARIETEFPPLYGGGAAWADYDNDGWLDVLLCGSGDTGRVTQIWRNIGTGFTNIQADLLTNSFGSPAWGDYDNDGKIDVFLGGDIWRNAGTGFTNIKAGLTQSRGFGSWGDYDNDERLDVLSSGNPGPGVRTQLWRNTTNGFQDVQATIPDAGRSAFGDYDNDGQLDVVVTSGYPVHWAHIFRNSNGSFANIMAGLDPVTDGSVAWGDFDNDGRSDILLTGLKKAPGIIKRQPGQVWRNTVSRFVQIDIDLPTLSSDSLAWGDYDNDGRLDMVLTGFIGSFHNVIELWKNRVSLSNSPPSAPTNLWADWTPAGLTFHWDPALDTETPSPGLSYSLRVGSVPGSGDIVSPPAAADGFRRLAKAGSINGHAWTLLRNLAPGTYYWSVQAVDPGFRGSAFAPEENFTVGPPTIDSIRHTDENEIHLNCTGIPEQTYVLESSSNLLNWVVWTNLPAGANRMFQIRKRPQADTEFYRLLGPAVVSQRLPQGAEKTF